MSLSRIGRSLAALAVAAIILVGGTAGIRAASLPFTPAADQGVFLHVSDIHFDPFVDPALVPRLIAAPVEDWAGILASSSAQAAYPQYGHDSSYALLTSMLEAAKGMHYDYIINTGDNLSHDFKDAFLAAGADEKDYESFAVKTMLFVNRMLTQSFAGVPLIYALGNNDSGCGDYMLAPQGTMLARLGGNLLASSPPALRDFATGGFYVVPHPTVAKHEIIVLSDVFWSTSYRDKCDPNGGDPGSAELAWLEWTLYQAKVEGRTVSLVMHIPPGIDAYSSARHDCPDGIRSFWKSAYADRFLALVGAYRDILRGSYAGHTHVDDFRVVSNASGMPLLTTQIGPAVSPVFNNNPAFTVLLYNRGDATVTDYATFYLANLEQAGATVAPDWKLAYTFGQAYGLDRYDPEQVLSLAQRIRTDPLVRQSFMQFYAVNTAARSPINDDNWSAYACAQTAMTPTDFAACQCPGAKGGKGAPQ